MPGLDLRPEWLEAARALLASRVPDSEVWAYGSRVTGVSHEGSDLDLVVRSPRHLGEPRRDLSELRAAFSNSDLPILVDVHDWARLPETLQREIERAHAVLWPAA